jgi:hypothetical protein
MSRFLRESTEKSKTTKFVPVVQAVQIVPNVWAGRRKKSETRRTEEFMRERAAFSLLYCGGENSL